MEHSGWISGEDLWQWRQSACQEIAAYTCDSPEADQYLRELDWLLTAATAVDRLALKLETYRTRRKVAAKRSLSELSALWQRRLQEKVPVQYLLGKAFWRDLTLTVAPGVLIPRPETELLIDLALAAVPHLPKTEPMQWADLGTGSGAIALALAKCFPRARIHAVDISAIALDVAQSNAEQLDLADRVQFYQGTWLEPLAHLKETLTGIISNPPYIPSGLVPILQPEVSQHEPFIALEGGADGLDAFRTIVPQAAQCLQPGGVLLLEMMQGQAEAVIALLNQSGQYCNLQLHPDLAGIERFAQAQRR